MLEQFWDEITARPDGPLALRFYLQPLVASLLALRDGTRDARAGRPAYLWSIAREPGRRRDQIADGWKSISKVFIIAIILDVVYQLVVLKGLRPLEGVLVAVALAIVPYAVLRGPVNRIVRATSRMRASWRARHFGQAH